MKILKVIIGTGLLLSSVNSIINGFEDEDGANLFGFIIGASLFGIIGIFLINSGFKK